jgi:hypothetical protein
MNWIEVVLSILAGSSLVLAIVGVVMERRSPLARLDIRTSTGERLRVSMTREKMKEVLAIARQSASSEQ